MRIYKERYTDKEGKRRKTTKWYIDFTDHRGKRHRLPGFAEKRLTQKLADNIETLVSCKIAGQSLDKSMQIWIDALPDKLLKKLISITLIDGQRAETNKLLSEHLKDWKNSLIASGCSEGHIKALFPRAEKIFDKCSFLSISDIDLAKVEKYLTDIRDIGQQVKLKAIDKKNGMYKTKTVKISKVTYNYYVRAARQFCKWMVDSDRITKSPLRSLKKMPITKADKKRPARSLTVQEIRDLIQTTMQSDDYRGISGQERALTYILANETGLRANEIRQLKTYDFDFQNNTLMVRAELSKNGKEAVLPLKQSTAIRLRQHLLSKSADLPAFNVPSQPHLMIKKDLERAGIQYRTEEGTAHFHAQRHNFATALDVAAKTAKTAQTLMRHSDPRLTLNIYTHGVAAHERAAIEALPDLSYSDDTNKERKVS